MEEQQAAPRTRIYFASDAHLGSPFHRNPLEAERKLCRWLESIRRDARALYLLGDMFDYWFEYRHVVPQGFTRFLGKLAELSDQGVEIHFLTGNHDLWIRDYLHRELGIILHRHAFVTELMGKTFRLSHGDEEYRRESRAQDWLYRIFHNPVLRILYGSIHPRWTVGLAQGLSIRSRRRGLRMESEGRVPHARRNDYFSLEEEPLIRFAKEQTALHPEVDYYLFGHRHLLVDMALKADRRVMILGDWIQYFSYAVWDGTHLRLEQFEAEQ